jgi:hypothetical protein
MTSTSTPRLGAETFSHGYNKLQPRPLDGVAGFATMLREPGPCAFSGPTSVPQRSARIARR